MPAARSSGTSCIRCFTRPSSRPTIRKVPSDKAVIDDVLGNVQPQIFGYLESQIDGKFLVGSTMTLADIAIVSNFIVYHIRLQGGRRSVSQTSADTSAASPGRTRSGKALEDEKPSDGEYRARQELSGWIPTAIPGRRAAASPGMTKESLRASLYAISVRTPGSSRRNRLPNPERVERDAQMSSHSA